VAEELFIIVYARPVLEPGIESHIPPRVNGCMENPTMKGGDAMHNETATQRNQIFTWRHNNLVKEVSLVGDFNQWIPTALSLVNGEFWISIHLAPGRYEYKFLVNGEWQNDSEALEFAGNEFGGTNSVLRVS
jgi:hypothetical protein